jgi:hypothetical protein
VPEPEKQEVLAAIVARKDEVSILLVTLRWADQLRR